MILPQTENPECYAPNPVTSYDVPGKHDGITLALKGLDNRDSKYLLPTAHSLSLSLLAFHACSIPQCTVPCLHISKSLIPFIIYTLPSSLLTVSWCVCLSIHQNMLQIALHWWLSGTWMLGGFSHSCIFLPTKLGSHVYYSHVPGKAWDIVCPNWTRVF